MIAATRRRSTLVLLCLVASGSAIACGSSAERPLLTATGLKFHKPGVSGLPVDVTFRVQNPNPKALDVERFSYEVFVNEHSIGRGFVPEPMVLDAFKDRQVVSRFNINYFSIPGAVKQILDQDQIDAKVRGTFYLRGRLWGRQLPFESTGVIPLRKDADANPSSPPGALSASAPAAGAKAAPSGATASKPPPKPKSTTPTGRR
jgi:LEA14-like dessication related protein